MPSRLRDRHLTSNARQRARFISLCLLLVAPCAFGSVRYASLFPGADIGEQINAAYADLPASGGAIILSDGGSFATPIVFGTNGKPALLIGLPGDVVTLSFTATSGTAIMFDYGTG